MSRLKVQNYHATYTNKKKKALHKLKKVLVQIQTQAHEKATQDLRLLH